MSVTHSRAGSDDTTCSASSYQAVLEHLLQYPGSYEIPLRTMYTLNCVSRTQPLPKQLTRAPSPTNMSPTSGRLAWSETGAATANFTSHLMHQITSLPTQPSSLPPSFIVGFVSRCFHADLDLVDFNQSLTAMDYLKDLENRRRREVEAAFKRLDVRPETVGQAVAEGYPGVAQWVRNIDAKDAKAEHLYTAVYLGLRRWTMINELKTVPFNKLNCLGMLNTLYPPPRPQAPGPTAVLNADRLKDERESFFTYIRQVEKHGNGVIKNLIEFNKVPGEPNGWSQVAYAVESYLTVAKNMIDDAMAANLDNFMPLPEAGNRKGKKTDSGVSFGAERRPSTGAGMKEKPLPASPIESKSHAKGLSTMEKITREFKRMRVKSRPEVEEIVKLDRQPSDPNMSATADTKMRRSLKKARSMATLSGAKGNASGIGSRKGSAAAEFDADTMQRHRAMYDATLKNSRRL